MAFTAIAVSLLKSVDTFVRFMYSSVTVISNVGISFNVMPFCFTFWLRNNTSESSEGKLACRNHTYEGHSKSSKTNF